MSDFEVTGFVEVAIDMQEWAEELEDVDMDQAKKTATTRASAELIKLIEKNIDQIPHDLKSLRESWRYTRKSNSETQLYSTKDYAAVYEYGAQPYDIEGNPLAFDASTWDNNLAKSKLGIEDGDTAYFEQVRHPGFKAYFYLHRAMEEFEKSGRFEEIIEEEIFENEIGDKAF